MNVDYTITGMHDGCTLANILYVRKLICTALGEKLNFLIQEMHGIYGVEIPCTSSQGIRKICPNTVRFPLDHTSLGEELLGLCFPVQ